MCVRKTKGQDCDLGEEYYECYRKIDRGESKGSLIHKKA